MGIEDVLTASSEDERRVKVTLYLPRRLLKRLREFSQSTGTAQSRLLTVLLKNYLDGVDGGMRHESVRQSSGGRRAGGTRLSGKEALAKILAGS